MQPAGQAAMSLRAFPPGLGLPTRGPPSSYSPRAASRRPSRDPHETPLDAVSGRPRLTVTTWSRMIAEAAKTPPPDCRQIVTRLRSGINRRSDRRTTSTGQSSLVNVHANRPLTPLLRRIDRQQSVRWGRGAGRQNRSRELAVPAACPIDQASGVSHGYQRTALHPR